MTSALCVLLSVSVEATVIASALCEAIPIWKMPERYFVYIITSFKNTVLYTGITNDLKRRIYEHKAKLVEGFTKRYNVTKLVYYEVFHDPLNAIAREKQIKGGSRQKKIDLIRKMNPEWRDLFDDL